jgi:hypothetical protein
MLLQFAQPFLQRFSETFPKLIALEPQADRWNSREMLVVSDGGFVPTALLDGLNV